MGRFRIGFLISFTISLLSVLMPLCWAETPAGTVISNTASIKYGDAGGYQYEARSDTVQTKVSGKARVSLSKSASPIEVPPGGRVVYTIFYRNDGNAPASQVTITDRLPEGLIFASAGNGGAFSDGVVRWELGVLPPKTSGTIQLTVRVAEGLSGGTIISNIAVIDSLETDPFTCPPATITVKGRPSLKVEKSGSPNPVLAGDEITYTISYENGGDAPAENVVLTDPLPQLTDFVLASNEGLFDASTKSVSWNVGKLEPGDKGIVQLVLKVDPNAPDGSVIRNVASISADGINPITSSPLDITVYQVPSVKASKELTEEVTIREGEEADIGYLIRYHNADSAVVARNVTITDDIPTTVAVFLNATGTYSVEKQNGEVKRVTWSLGDVNPGEGGEIRVTLRTKSTIKTNDAVVNTGSIRGDNFSPLVFAAPPVVVVRAAAPAPKLEIVKTVDKLTANPGDTLIYVIKYRNTGDADAIDVVVEDELPDWISPVPNSITQGGSYAEGKITWELGNLPYGGDWYTLSFRAKIGDLIPKPEVFIRNRAAIYQRGVAIEPERIYSDYVETRVPGNSAGPSVSIIADPDEILGDGEQISTLTVTVYADATLKQPPPPGTKVTITTSHGRFPNGGQSIDLVTDEGGRAVTQLTADLVGDTYIEAQAVAVADTPYGSASDTVRIIFYPGAISGLVTDFSKGNRPVQGLNLVARDKAMVPLKPATTGGDGRFTIFLPKPNFYTVTLESTDNLGRRFQIGFDVVAKEAFGKVYYISNAIAGYLTDAMSGKPVPDAEIRLRTSVGSPVATVTTDQNGSYLFRGLNPDLYTVEVVKVPEGYKGSGPVQVDDTQKGQVVLNVGLELERAADVKVTKSVDRSLATRGDILTYTISYINTGGPISDAELIDELPPNIVLVQASEGGRLEGGVVRWSLGLIPMGGSGDVKLVVRISDTAPESFTLTNTALVRSLTDPTLQFRSPPVQTLVGTAAITLQKRVDRSEVKPGDRILYTISYKNTGSLDLNGITLTDSLPRGLTLVSAPGARIERDKVSWSIDKLQPNASGSVSLMAQVDEGISTEREIVNTAMILVTYPKVEAQSTAQITVKPERKPALELTKEASTQSALPGDVITYRLKLKNTGSAPATDVVITDLLPPQLEYIGAGDYDPSTGRLTIKVGTLPAQSDEMSFQYQGRVSRNLKGEIGFITNSATVTCAEGITATAFAKVRIEPLLSLRKSADKEYASSNEDVMYTIAYRNEGGMASDLVISDVLPKGMILLSAEPEGRYDEGSRTITWSLDQLKAGASGAVKLTVRISQDALDGMTLKNIAHLTFSGGKIDSNEVVLRVSNPKLILSKRASLRSVGPGEEFKYTISFENRGSSDATDVKIVDKLPDELSYRSATLDPINPNPENDKEITWSLDAIPAGGSGEIEITVVASDKLTSDVITNLASIESKQTPKMKVSSSVNVKLESALSFSKLASELSLRAGDKFKYTFKIDNAGPADAHNLKVTDPLPGDIEFLKALTDGVSYDPTNHTLSFTYPLLSAGETISASFEVRVKPDLSEMKSIQNTATLSCDEVEGLNASVAVSATPIYIRVVKTASRRTVEVGDFITYTIKIKNTSDKVRIKDLTLRDSLPNALTYIEGSSELDGKGVSDPVVSNGDLTWKLGTLEPLGEMKLVYRAVLDPGLYSGEISLTNVAWAEGVATSVSPSPAPLTASAPPASPVPTKSNESEWTVKVRRGIFAEEGVIIGKVFLDENENGFQDPGEKGVPYARIIMEDGTLITTDEFGKYSVPEVSPGYHVLKLDVSRLPRGYSVIHSSTRDGGDPISQFAYMMPGGLEKIDFALKYSPQPVKLELPKPEVIQPQPQRIPPPKIKVPEFVIPLQPVQITVAAPILIEPELDPNTPGYVPPKELWESRQRPVERAPIRLETPSPAVVPPEDPPQIKINFSMFQIPPGDPKLIVTVISSEPIKEVRGKRLDDRELRFNMDEAGRWVARFTVPFTAPDGPYPFEIKIYDTKGIEWDYMTWVMVDSTMPIIFGEFFPRSTSPGQRVRLKVNLLVEAEEVTARIDGRTMKLNRINPFHWWLDYTVPSDARRGIHKAEITVVAKEESIRLKGIITYRVR